MAAESGQFGLAKIGSTVVAYVTGWTMQKSVVEEDFYSNETAGYAANITGGKRAQGTLQLMLNHSAASTVMEGAAITLLLYLNATKFYTVPCNIIGFNVTLVVEGKPTKAESNFKSNGAYTEPTW